MSTAQVTGVKEALKTLRQLDPEMRTQFNNDAKNIAAPAINAAQSRYQVIDMPSGLNRRWRPNNRIIFPATRTRMANRVKLKIDTRQKANSVLKIVNTDAGATIIEWAGVRTYNPLASALSRRTASGTPRVMWPVVDRYLPQIRDGFEQSLKEVERELNRRLD